jgi:hypothetical protein
MNHTFHTLVALHLPRKHGDFLVYASHIVASMTDNPHFPSPTPALTSVAKDIKALQAAETATQTHTKGAADARDLPLQQLVTDMHQLAAYVQTVADANPTEAASIIASAGFGTHPHGIHATPDLAAHMAPGGLVALRAHAVGKRAAYEWQMSLDGGKTWTSLPSTTTASTSVPGLAVGTSYMFRFRGDIGHQTGDWHQPVTMVVH